MASQEDRSIPGLVIVTLEGDVHGAVLGVWSKRLQTSWVPMFQDPMERPAGRGNITTCAYYKNGVYRLLSEAEASGQWLYKFEVLPEGERSTGPIRLEAAWLEAEAAKSARQRSFAAKSHASRYYAWALGWLPARFQDRLAEKHGFDAGEGSAANGIIEFMAGMVLGILATVSMFVGGLSGLAESPMPLYWVPIAVLMIFEGFGRWVYCRSSDEARGLYILEGLDWLLRRLGR